MRSPVMYAVSMSMIIILINVGLCQQLDEEIKFKSSSSYIRLNVITENVSERNATTNVVVNKSVEGLGSKLRYTYNIKTPPVDDFQFVLSLDSSASLKTGSNSQQANAVIGAIPSFIEKTIQKYPNKNFSVSLVSWDDDIDFAYHDFGNDDPKKAKLVSIQNCNDDLLKNKVFGEGKTSDKNYAYYCLGNESTNLSLALQAPIDILKNNPVIKHHRTSKFIILVVGEGEITDECNDSLIEEARKEGISIYAILMNPSEGSYLLDHLSNVTDNKTQSCQAPEGQLQKLLEMKLENALEQAISEPAATNVTLTEYSYSCCRPEEDALIEISGSEISRIAMPVKCENATFDLSNRPISVTFPIPTGLYPDSVTTITFDTSFSLSLPGSVDETRPSSLKYIWLKENELYNITVPGNNINIVSSPEDELPEPPSSSSQQEKIYSGNRFGILTILSFIITIAIIKHKR